MTSSTTWQNFPFGTQSGMFTAEFDAIPNAVPIDAVTGLSTTAATGYSQLAAIVRFNSSGTIDARNGSVYAAAATVPYSAWTNYHFRLVVNVPAKTYSIYVSPDGGSEITLGTNYAFRTEQSNATSLSNWAMHATSGSHWVCDFELSDVPSALQSTHRAPSLRRDRRADPSARLTNSTRS